MEGGTEIRDEVPTGPCLRFKRPTGCSSFRLELRGITFRNSQTSAGNKDTKMDHPVLELEKMTHLNSVIEACSFRSLDSGQKAYALARLVDCFMTSFDRCYFDGTSIGTLVRIENPTINGGESGVIRCHFNNLLGAALQISGSSVAQNVSLYQSKFVAGSGGASRIRISASDVGDITDFTQGATVLDIGTGHTLAAGDALVIANDNSMEIVYVASYSSPNVTLVKGLARDWSSDASLELMVGPFGPVFGKTTRAIDASLLHTEGVSSVLTGCTGFHWRGGTATGTTAAKLSSGDAYHVFALGDPCYGHRFERVAMDTPGATNKLVKVINSSGGSGNVPGPMVSEFCFEQPNDALIENVIDWTDATDKGRWMSQTAGSF